MIYSTALRPFLERRPEALDLLEIEPQTLWLADHPIKGPFFEFTPGIALYADLPGHKLVHSVGIPLGGTRRPDPDHLGLLRATADRLQSPWVSEHLAVAGTPHRAAGFLLPPIQTEEGVEIAVENIRAFKAAMGRPVAIETGVAYLRRKDFEMPDGEFVARIVREADCGILLDLHNIYCNHRNGRIVWDEFLSQIPLDRVWEVHLAGGAEMDGYWLDSHSGPMPDDLIDRSLAAVRALPNLGALNFEIYDTFLEKLEPETFDKITDDLRRIWSDAGHDRSDAPPVAQQGATGPAPAPGAWEEALTRAVWKAEAEAHPWVEDEVPVKLYAFLARSFRGSILARSLPRLLRYLLLRDGKAVESMLKAYYRACDPKLYAPLECDSFSSWLRESGEEDPWALALLDYDLAFMAIVRHPVPQIVRFPGDPSTVFEALAERRMPVPPPPPQWEVEILPDLFSVEDFAQAAGS